MPKLSAHLFLCLLLLSVSSIPCVAGFRISVGPNPALQDYDEDGLTNEDEDLLGTDPEEADTDGDGFTDYEEMLAGTDPLDSDDYPSSVVTASAAAGNLASATRKAVPLATLLEQLKAQSQLPQAKESLGFSARYFFATATPRHLSVQLDFPSLKSGSYVIMWQQRASHLSPAQAQRYLLTLRASTGRILQQWDTPHVVTGEWQKVFVAFTIQGTAVDEPLTLSMDPVNGGPGEFEAIRMVVKTVALEVDANRDGRIIAREQPAATRPWRLWLNDDYDAGESQLKADIPGRFPQEQDTKKPGINGLRDLVDFFPLNLGVTALLNNFSPAQGYHYFLEQTDGALQFTLTGLTPDRVGLLHRDPDLAVFGPDLEGDLTQAEILRPNQKNRVEIPASFLQHIVLRGHGILLAEATQRTTKPLRLIVEKDENTVGFIELPLQVGPVEEMYRHVNLCTAAWEFAGRPARIKTAGRRTAVADPPALPDAETAERWVVLVHGYSVDGDSARGWHAETFKRLYALGSNARFVGVTWNGDTGLDYHKAVFHAFQTGAALSGRLNFLDPARTLLIGHSLGNIVCSEAIQQGFTPGRYFLLNAALPSEAIEATKTPARQRLLMTEELWRPYAPRLLSSEWFGTQPRTSLRRTYTWRNAFGRVGTNGTATNCFSAGEDVTNCPDTITNASVLAALWAGRAIDYGVWKTQELVKGVGWGRSLAGLAMERAQGGWGFNSAWKGEFVSNGNPRGPGGHYARMQPWEAARISNYELLTQPFFQPFEENYLHSLPSRLGSPLVSDDANIRYDLLARAIPATSFAAGGAPVAGLLTTDGPHGLLGNFDLEAQGRIPGRRWPRENHTAKHAGDRWLHSDFKNVALPFVHPLFLAMISQAQLR